MPKITQCDKEKMPFLHQQSDSRGFISWRLDMVRFVNCKLDNFPQKSTEKEVADQRTYQMNNI